MCVLHPTNSATSLIPPSTTSLMPNTLSNKNEKIFSHCLDYAQDSNLLFRHGCIATVGGKIIASGCNTHKTYSRDMFLNNNCGCSCHAEMNVLRQIYYRNKHNKRKLNKIMKKTTLYISRCSSTGESTNSAPCVECLKVIKHYNIKKLIFNLDDNYYIMNSKNYHTTHRTTSWQNLCKNGVIE